MKIYILCLLAFVGYFLTQGCSNTTVKTTNKLPKVVIAINPNACGTCAEKAGKLAKDLSKILPTEYVFKVSDSTEVNFYLKNLVQFKRPYKMDNELFANLTKGNDENSTICVLDKNEKPIYSHIVKTLNDSDIKYVLLPKINLETNKLNSK